MSFLVPVVDDEVTGHEPNEYAENVYDWELFPAAAVDGFLCYKNNKIQRVQSGKLSWYGRKIQSVYDYTATFATLAPSSLGDLDLACTREFRVGSNAYLRPSSIKMYSNTHFIVALAGSPWCFYVSGGDIRTSPPGNGHEVYADAFIEHSSRRHKTDIAPIADFLTLFKRITAKAFTMGGKSRFGFIAEELPKRFVREFESAEGEPEKGVDTSSLLGLLWRVVRNLEKRLSALEGGIS
jgi:hypothetical protein